MKSFPVPRMTRIALYVRDIPKVAAFYCQHFRFTAQFSEKKDKAVLTPAEDGCGLVLLQLSKGQKAGQSVVKIIFDVPDVIEMKKMQAKMGLKFGAIHHGPGYKFANARDPAKNLIQISNSYMVDQENFK